MGGIQLLREYCQLKPPMGVRQISVRTLKTSVQKNSSQSDKNLKLPQELVVKDISLKSSMSFEKSTDRTWAQQLFNHNTVLSNLSCEYCRRKKRVLEDPFKEAFPMLKCKTMDRASQAERSQLKPIDRQALRGKEMRRRWRIV